MVDKEKFIQCQKQSMNRPRSIKIQRKFVRLAILESIICGRKIFGNDDTKKEISEWQSQNVKAKANADEHIIKMDLEVEMSTGRLFLFRPMDFRADLIIITQNLL